MFSERVTLDLTKPESLEHRKEDFIVAQIPGT